MKLDIVQSIHSPAADTMESRMCLICDNETNFYKRNFAKSKTKHSRTAISECLTKICGGDNFISQAIDDEGRTENICDQRVICSDCVDKIDEYDAACVMIERIEREYRGVMKRLRKFTAKKLSKISGRRLRNSVKTEDCDEDDNSENVPIKCEPEDTADTIDTVETVDTVDGDELDVYQEKAEFDDIDVKETALTVTDEDHPVETNEVVKLSRAKSKGKKLKDLECGICGIIADNADALSEHIPLHDGKSPRQCITCEQHFSSRAAMARHTRIHTGNRLYQCEKCGKSFVHPSSLEMHIRAHEDIREKQCPHCPHQSRSTSHLNRHLRIHTGAKPFECPKCQQRFAQRYNMTVHLRLHDSTEKSKTTLKHVCTICKSAYARPSKLAEHYLLAHQTLMPQANKVEATVARENETGA